MQQGGLARPARADDADDFTFVYFEVYAFEDFVADAQNFYQTFYGFELDASLITK